MIRFSYVKIFRRFFIDFRQLSTPARETRKAENVSCLNSSCKQIFNSRKSVCLEVLTIILTFSTTVFNQTTFDEISQKKHEASHRFLNQRWIRYGEKYSMTHLSATQDNNGNRLCLKRLCNKIPQHIILML